MRIFFILFFSLITLFKSVNGQNYPKNAFIAPLNIPLILAGTFAELRSNHFHSGIDIKTQGLEGKEVLAAADGFVSRIKVSPYGYGNALYITHPNGYTTVYAHLQSFSPEIQAYTKKQQYAKKSFAVNLFPGKGQFMVKQGDIIGLSGNSGGSAAPHLHFEIRNTKTEEPINPLLFGFDISDQRDPVLQRLYVYPLSENSRVNGLTEKAHFDISKGTYGKHFIQGSIKIQGPVGFGIETYDCQDGAWNRNGVYSVELFKNGSLFYEHKMECFAFHETRYINSLMDYSEKFCCNRKPQKSFIEPNNKLRIYANNNGNGILTPESNTSYDMRYQVSDVAGNISTLEFVVNTDEGFYEAVQPDKFGIHFSLDEENNFDTEGLQLTFPKGCFYTDIDFSYQRNISDSNLYFSPFHILQPEETPVHERFEMAISPDRPIPAKYMDKATIYAINPDSYSPYSVGGTWNNGQLVASIRNMGWYTIGIDSIAPSIQSCSIENGNYVKDGQTIKIVALDRESGIGNYEAFVDSKWVLLAYDAKKNLFYHELESGLSTGKHLFEIRLTDEKQNTTTKQITFFK